MPNTKNVFIVIGLISAVFFIYNFWSADLVLGDDVTVSATISTSVTCSASTSTTGFGTLTTSVITTSTPDVTLSMSCNYALGCTLSVKDVGDFGSNPCLHSTSSGDVIGSTNTTLVAGIEGYGIQATSTALTINPIYNKTGNDVGGLTIGGVDVSSSTAPISSETTVIKHKAAISGLTKAATDYTDILTYSCLGNT